MTRDRGHAAGGSVSAGHATRAVRERRGVGQFLLAEMGQFRMAKNNADVFTYVVCGVSAQGVSYNDAAGLALVAGEGAAATRIRVRPEPPSGGHDVTSMIRWLMSQ